MQPCCCCERKKRKPRQQQAVPGHQQIAAGAGSSSAVAAGSSRTGGRLAQKRHGQGAHRPAVFFRSRHCSNAGQIHAIQSTSASLYRPSSDPQALAPARSPDHRHWFSPDPNQDLKLLGEEGGHACATRVCGAPTHPILFARAVRGRLECLRGRQRPLLGRPTPGSRVACVFLHGQ